MNGAVGNFNAHVVAYPAVDWPRVTKIFIEVCFLFLDRTSLTFYSAGRFGFDAELLHDTN